MTETNIRPLKFTREEERKLQLIQLIGLLELKRLFDKHNLKYTLAFGSLIGAVRHQGFIPWDDDLDVTMPRDDYNRLKEICKSELSPDFFLQYPDTDRTYAKSIMRLRINNTKLIQREYMDWGVYDGIYVDIYPADHIPDNKIKRFIYKYLSKYLLISTQIICLPPKKRKSVTKKILAVILPFPLRIFSHEKIIQIREKYLSKYNAVSTREMIIQGGENYQDFSVLSVDFFSNRLTIPFEEVNVYIPAMYDLALRKQYGNYMELPPIEMRCQHHGYLSVDFGKYESLEYILKSLNKYGLSHIPADPTNIEK